MSRGVLGKNNWALVLLILVGVVLGGLIGKLCAGVPALSWLSYGQSFGFVNPMVLDSPVHLVLDFLVHLVLDSPVHLVSDFLVRLQM